MGSAETIEYAYDDGTAETAVYFKRAGDMIALKFTPLFKGELENAMFYIRRISSNESENIVKIHVLYENRQDIITPFYANFSEGWCEVDLSNHDIEISTEFYIGLEFTVDDSPNLGQDSNNPCIRNCSWNGTEWFYNADYDAYMIRAKVKSSYPLTLLQGATPPPTGPIHPFVYGLVIAIAAIVIIGILLIKGRSTKPQFTKIP